MRTFLTMLVVLVTALCMQPLALRAVADEHKRDDTQSTLQKLQGLWEKLPGGMMHRDGRQVVYQPGIDGTCFFIHADRLIWLDKDGKPTGEEMKLKLDTATKPKRITFTPVGETKKKPVHGIYAIEGASLRLHVGLDGGRAPKQFLELNMPVKGVNGRQWLVARKKLQSK
jgi:uncharacterized protein (TIGR03067 family)